MAEILGQKYWGGFFSQRQIEEFFVDLRDLTTAVNDAVVTDFNRGSGAA
jgi:hypothetical protein